MREKINETNFTFLICIFSSKTVQSSRLAHLKQEHSVTRQKILTPRELQEQSNNKLQETYIIEKYKAQVELAVKELERNFKEFEKSPENHPGK